VCERRKAGAGCHPTRRNRGGDPEDASLAAENGIDSIIVSDRGERVDDSGRSTIGALPEVIEAFGGRMPVLVDSGFRRGADNVKALAISATAVGIGRPYLWGLGAFGQVESSACLKSFRPRPASRCSNLGRHRSKLSRRRW
jgi:4-hydroxymandelate oxidase